VFVCLPCEDGRDANRRTNRQPGQLTHLHPRQRNKQRQNRSRKWRQAATTGAGLLAYRSRVRGDGEGDEHHVEGDDDLDDERVPVRARRRGGAQHGDGVQHGLEHERRADGAGELRRPVERDLQPQIQTFTRRASSSASGPHATRTRRSTVPTRATWPADASTPIWSALVTVAMLLRFGRYTILLF
jgi:hypothetical protein